MTVREEKQKLVDCVFAVGLIIQEDRGYFDNKSLKDTAEWIREKLIEEGFNVVETENSKGILQPSTHDKLVEWIAAEEKKRITEILAKYSEEITKSGSVDHVGMTRDQDGTMNVRFRIK
jgi:hypothetical protein